MEVPYGFVNGMNPCFTFYLRLKDCHERESFPNLFCLYEAEDYNECRFKKRLVYFK